MSVNKGFVLVSSVLSLNGDGELRRRNTLEFDLDVGDFDLIAHREMDSTQNSVIVGECCFWWCIEGDANFIGHCR